MSFIETSDGDYLNLAEVRQLRRVSSPQRGNTERLIANTKDNGQIDCGHADQATAALRPIIPAHPGYVRLTSWGFFDELAPEELQDCFQRAPIIAWWLGPNGPFPIADNDAGIGRPHVWAVRRPDGSVFLPYDEGSAIDPGTFESEILQACRRLPSAHGGPNVKEYSWRVESAKDFEKNGRFGIRKAGGPNAQNGGILLDA